jgi:hypothetical protein
MVLEHNGIYLIQLRFILMINIIKMHNNLLIMDFI